MLVDSLDFERQGRVVRASAQVHWEDSDRPNTTYAVEIDDVCGDWFWPDPNAFFLAAIIPAWYQGEQRIAVSDPVCPLLREQIRAALSTLALWYPMLGDPPIIQAPAESRYPSGQAASLLSCGVDSLTTLRLNQLALPGDHPAAIRTVLTRFGLDLDGSDALRLNAAKRVADAAGVDFVAVRSNSEEIESDGYFFSYQWHGALLAATGYMFSRGISKIYIASSDDAGSLGPWGSHPLLDPYYGSGHVAVEHHGTHMTRLEKTAVIAGWPEGLANLIVCNRDPSRFADGYLNCGTCEKCLRTKTALVALGKLHEGASFAEPDLTPEMLAWIGEYQMIYSRTQAISFRELIEPLEARGRSDLSAQIVDFLAGFVPRTVGW